MKIFFLKLLNVVLIAAVLFIYQSYALSRKEKVDAYEKKVSEYKRAKSALEGTRADGTYTGSGDGYGGRVTIQVTIENHSIKEVKLLSADKETPEYLKKAKRLLQDIVNAQSANVDVVSGATLSSVGILQAAREALKKSGL